MVSSSSNYGTLVGVYLYTELIFERNRQAMKWSNWFPDLLKMFVKFLGTCQSHLREELQRTIEL
jgi:hypothetical protein